MTYQRLFKNLVVCDFFPNYQCNEKLEHQPMCYSIDSNFLETRVLNLLWFFVQL